jgi:hypothetical protein
MNKNKGSILAVILVLSLMSLTCSTVNRIIKGNDGTISDLTFCADVTDEGECVEPGAAFSGVEVIWARFDYRGMKDGQRWGYAWEQDDQIIEDYRDLSWKDGEEGWVAYSLEDIDGLEGRYMFTLYLAGETAAEGSATVSRSSARVNRDAAAFGTVVFARDVSDDNLPIGPADVFEYGISEVYGVFSYVNMNQGDDYTVEWLGNGKPLHQIDKEWEWDEDGMYFASISNADGSPLVESTYTLKLSIGGKVLRTASFKVLPPAQAQAQLQLEPEATPRPTTPDELVDPEARHLFDMVANTSLPALTSVAQVNMEHSVQIKVEDQCGPDALACWIENCNDRSTGTIYIPPRRLGAEPDYMIAASLAHEMTHGVQWFSGMKCGCTIEREVQASIAKIDYLLYSGHEQVAYAYYGSVVWDENGDVDLSKLWNTVEEVYREAYTYEECPDY